MIRKLTISLTLLCILLAACGQTAISPKTAETKELVPIRLPMGYIPNVQYAPWYVAVGKGYFAEAGFEIIFDYSYETDGLALVGANELPFSIASAEQVLLARAQGIPVVYVLAWYQGFPTAVVAKAETGVTTPQDLAGKRIGLPGLFGASYIGLRALLNAGGVTESQVTLESIGFTQVQSMVDGQQDIIVGYETNEPVQLRALGYDVNVVMVDDYITLPGNGLITNETVMAENPEMVSAFIDAFLHGLADTLANPDEAYELCAAHVENLAELDEEVQKQVLASSIRYWQAEVLGMSDHTAWENLQALLLDMDLITEPQELDAAYSNRFIN